MVYKSAGTYFYFPQISQMGAESILKRISEDQRDQREPIFIFARR
jgi:hypothetical protein